MQSQSEQQEHAAQRDLGRDGALCSFRSAHVLPDFQCGHLFDSEIREHGSLLSEVGADGAVRIARARNEDGETDESESCTQGAEDHGVIGMTQIL